jgi:pSer/pThr/pTyr-binding forkhead associated (FHA) protein
VCSSCGYENPKYEHYCRKCGFLLTIPGDINSKTPAGILKNPRLIDELGHVYSVKPGVNTIGRENSDIVLPDKTVSRQHAHIVYDEDRDIYSIEDLGSTNGTFLNSLRLSQNSPNPVLPGDDLQFGSFAVRVVSGSSPSDAAISIAPSHASEHLTAQTHTLSPQTKTDALVVGQLKLLQGGGPSEVPITLGANTLGRMADNVICIRADRYVSGHHAVLNADEQVFRLTDLGSTNGTFLNGLRLTPNEAVAISDGDEITLGGAVFIFRRGPINVE